MNIRAAALRSLLAVGLAIATLGTASLAASEARAETRTLDLYFTHTKQRKKITFKKNGKYIKSGLRKINRLLRDHRRKEATRMDPRLFDIVWEIYKEVGGKRGIHVISGYRSPKTNAMLRRRGRKTARKSQHMLGKAMDWRIPGVSVAKLNAAAMRRHGGGVGHYRNSFIHTDTGRVRHWPRMSRRQLARIFPKGRTIHVPSNGKPLRGYKVALANLKKGRRADGRRPRYKSDGQSKTLLARLFRRDDGTDTNEDGDVAAAKRTLPTPAVKPAAPKPAAAPEAAPAQTVVAAAPANTIPANTIPANTGTDLFAADAKRALEETPAEAPVRIAKAIVPTNRPVRRPGADLDGTPAALESFSVAELKQRRAAGSQAIAYAGAEADAPGAAAVEALATGRPALPVGNVSAPAAPAVELASVEPSAASQRSIADLKQRIGASLAPNKPRKPIAEQLAAIQPAPLRRPQAPAIDEPIVTAALAPNTPPARSARTLAEQVRRDVLKSAKRTIKPLERNGDITFVRVSADAQPVTFVIGNLYGRTVKTWATARTTRRGLFATLHAPHYKSATTLPTPGAVFATGFKKQRRQRTDAFTGTSMLKVRYQELAALR